MAAMIPFRVRNILSNMDSAARANLKKLLPKGIKMPEAPTAKYPSAILAIFPKDECYSLLGFVAEEMLRHEAAAITLDSLHIAILKYYPAYTAEHRAKITKSKTTQPFLDILVRTRTALAAVIKGTLVFDTTVAYGAVEGHPDAQTDTQLFEVKLTGLMKKNWVDFLFQVFAYGALRSEATNVYLVLPLQATVWSFALSGWKTRTQYRDALNALATARGSAAAPKSVLPGQMLQMTHCIGNHIHKQKTMVATLTGIPAILGRPYQVFLSGPQSTKVVLKDEDIAAAAGVQAANAVRLYVHSPYIINLCQEPGTKEDYGVACLIKNLQYSVAMGLRGVVVHVGKSTTMALDVAEAHMRANILKALEHATDDCPLLLETPAGQGTEMLKDYASFLTFVQSFNSKKLRVCVDTCHVFATGQNPLEYITAMYTVDPTLVKLVHFNDSAAACGSCLDRHAFIGTGEIGYTVMKAIADYCFVHSVPMLVE